MLNRTIQNNQIYKTIASSSLTLSKFQRAKFFGGGGSGGSDVEHFDPYKGTGVRDLYKALGDWVKPQIGESYPTYSGKRIAGISPLQSQAIGLTEENLPGLAGGTMQIGQDMLSGIRPGTSGRSVSLAEDTLNQLMQPNNQGSGIQDYTSGFGTAKNLLPTTGDKAQQTLQDLMQPYDREKDTQYWQNAMVQPAMRQFKEQTMPAIAERYGTGGTGSGFNRAMSKAGSNLSSDLSSQLANLLYSGRQANTQRRTNLGSQLANLQHQGGQADINRLANLGSQISGRLYSGRQADLARQQQGVNQAMNLSQMPGQLASQGATVGAQGSDLLNQLMNMGTFERGLEKEQIGADWQEWMASQPYNNPILQNYLQTALQQPAMGTNVVDQPPGLGQQLMGGLGSFLGAGGLGKSGIGSGVGTFGTMGNLLTGSGTGGALGTATGGSLGSLIGGI